MSSLVGRPNGGTSQHRCFSPRHAGIGRLLRPPSAVVHLGGGMQSQEERLRSSAANRSKVPASSHKGVLNGGLGCPLSTHLGTKHHPFVTPGGEL